MRSAAAQSHPGLTGLRLKQAAAGGVNEWSHLGPGLTAFVGMEAKDLDHPYALASFDVSFFFLPPKALLFKPVFFLQKDV